MSGFFGCVSRVPCVTDVYYGTDYHSHLGTKRAGMAFYDGKKFLRSIHNLQNDYFRSQFERELPRFENSRIGIGVISDTESQPIVMTGRLGRFALVTVAKIFNINELAQELLAEKLHFSELSDSDINPTELVAVLISRASSFEEGIRLVYSKVKGSCSMLIMTENGIYAARDKYGRTPIVIGRNANGYVAAFESTSFTNLGYEPDYFLGAGETRFITAEEHRQVIAPGKKCQICAFLWVYYGYPTACYEGVNVEEARYRNGASLARHDDTEADFVAGIPDSGIGHAIGYSNEKHLPYRRPFVKYTPTWPRSFMPQYQNMLDLVAKMKLLTNEALTRDARIIFLDDSIVRGTQLKDNVSKLYEAGVKEVHIRVACPPLIYSCDFLNFSSSRSILDLMARKVIAELEGGEVSDEVLREYADASTARYARMIEQMRRRLNLTSLKFQTLPELVEAIGLPKDMLCTHCWDNSSCL